MQGSQNVCKHGNLLGKLNFSKQIGQFNSQFLPTAVAIFRFFKFCFRFAEKRTLTLQGRVRFSCVLLCEIEIYRNESYDIVINGKETMIL